MSKKIIVFSSLDDATGHLRNYNNKIGKTEMSQEEIINKSVGSNIFRAFQGLRPQKPSNIYREWARKNFDVIIRILNTSVNEKKFSRSLFGLFDSLIYFWAKKVKSTDQRISFGPASKMVNLLIKLLHRSSFIENKNLGNYLHVPFDRFTLMPLTNVINDLVDVRYKILIPKSPSMKFIINPELYSTMQRAVKKLCDKSSIYPISYEYWCWDEKH